ncbi:MAG: hypothetical protein HY049_19780 [Acidobacteria bacterium]|nr:hypothetical protein [Acidobacteriota bacterium]
MASSSSSGGPLIGIRPSKKPEAQAAASAEISVVLPLSACAGEPGDAIERAVTGLEAGGEPFELLVVAPAGIASADPRVRFVTCAEGSDRGEELRAGVLAAATEFIVPLLSGAIPAAGETRALREAMESFGAYSYLPGSPAADLAMVVRARSLTRRVVVYGLVGVYGSDFSGPVMFRRALFERIGADKSGAPRSLLEIAVRAKRTGCAVRSVPLPEEPASHGRNVPLAEVWRVRLRVRAAALKSD